LAVSVTTKEENKMSEDSAHMGDAELLAIWRLIDESVEAKPPSRSVFGELSPQDETSREREQRVMSEAHRIDRRLRDEHADEYGAWVDSQAWRLLYLELREADRVRRAHERADAKITSRIKPRKPVRLKPAKPRYKPEFQRALDDARERDSSMGARPDAVQ
jgi:hypothetical protein